MSVNFEQNLSVVNNLYRAFNERDAATVFDGLSPEVEIYQTDLLPWGGKYRGFAGAEDFFSKLLGHIDSRVEITEMFAVSHNMVSAIGRSRGITHQSKKRFDVAVVHLWTIKEDKVAKFEVYIDAPKMLEALKDN